MKSFSQEVANAVSEGSHSWGSPVIMDLCIFRQSNMGTVKAQGIKGAEWGQCVLSAQIKASPPTPTLRAPVSIITLTMTLWPECKHGLFWRKGLILYFLAFVKAGNLTLKKVIQVRVSS